jgi:hypothetical protein
MRSVARDVHVALFADIVEAASLEKPHPAD